MRPSVVEKLEKEIETKFTPYAAEHGCLAKKFVVEGTKGVPDRIVLCPLRRIFFIEFKRPIFGEESVHQERFRKTLESLGHKVYVIDSLREAKKALLSELSLIA